MPSKLDFLVRSDEHGIGKVLIPTSPWDNAYADFLHLEKITAIRLSYSLGYRGESIDFIRQFPWLRSLEVYSVEVRDLSPISHLPNLEVLGLQTKAATGFALRDAPLRIAMIQWNHKLSPLFELEALEYLNVINYPYIDLLPLRKLLRLQRLSITSWKLQAVNGIEELPALSRLDLYNCPQLLSIDEARSKQSIHHLEIEACRHVSNGKLIEKRSV
jgi:Leucine-rich repeat (LRR) protein